MPHVWLQDDTPNVKANIALGVWTVSLPAHKMNEHPPYLIEYLPYTSVILIW